MADKIKFTLSPSQFSSASIDLLTDIHALLQTQFQYLVVDQAEKRSVSEDEAMKEVNELYQRIRREKMLKLVSEFGEPDVNLDQLDPNKP